MQTELKATDTWPRRNELFGILYSATNYAEAVDAIAQAARSGAGGIVSCHAVHATVTFSQDPELTKIVNTFEMITPDGQPVRWALNWGHRTGLSDRVYGPELMLQTCQRAAADGLSIYLYGGTDDVLAKLKQQLTNLYPTLKVAGMFAPPFRQLTNEEEQEVANDMNQSGANIVFIGLGCPKQDLFAHRQRSRISAVQICVGAAFDFHAGVKKMAPGWMQRNGLEWMYRLSQEPSRLWLRYLTTNSIFVYRLVPFLIRRRVYGMSRADVARGSSDG